MSDNRRGLIQALDDLTHVLTRAVIEAPRPEHRRTALQYRDLTAALVSTLTTTAGDAYLSNLSAGSLAGFAERAQGTGHVVQAGAAAGNVDWGEVLRRIYAILDELPGDPVTWPKKPLPPP